MKVIYTALIIVFVAIVAIFCGQNMTTTSLDFLGWSATAPLPAFLVGMYFMGMLTGWMAVSFARHSIRRSNTARLEHFALCFTPSPLEGEGWGEGEFFSCSLSPGGRGAGGEGEDRAKSGIFRKWRKAFPLTPGPSPSRGEGRKNHQNSMTSQARGTTKILPSPMRPVRAALATRSASSS